MSKQETLAWIEAAVASFNTPSERPKYFDMYADNVALHGFPPGLPAGKAGVKAFFGGFWEAFPDAILKGDDVVGGEGDRVSVRFTIEATHRGAFAGVPATGKRVAITGQTILRFANGKCVERWNLVDMMGLMQQLGALPS